MLKGGHTKTWCMDDSLVTITTSRGNSEECSQCQSFNQNTGTGCYGNKEPCNCQCRGWAEVSIHRPTGDVSWVMRLQNWIVSDNGCGLQESECGPYNGCDVHDNGLLALHRPLHRHNSFEVLTNQPNCEDVRDGSPVEGLNCEGVGDGTPVEGSNCEGVREVTPIESQNLMPVNKESEIESIAEKEEKMANEQNQNSSGETNSKPPVKVPPQEQVDVNKQEGNFPLAHPPEAGSIQNTAVSSEESSIATTDISAADSALHSQSLPEGVTSYSDMASLEHLPPLMSYDDKEDMGRSPPLTHTQLSEHDQVCMCVCVCSTL